MSRNPQDKYEKKHLERPYFLEKYFQKQTVWIVTLVIITPLMLWGFALALKDVIVGGTEFSPWQEVVILIGVPLGIVAIYQEYVLYRDNLWHKDKKQ